MNRLVIAILILLTASPALAAKKKPMTEEQKAIYAVGLVIARQLSTFDLTPAEIRIMKRGLRDGLKGRKPLVDFAAYSKKSQELGIARRDAHGAKLAAKAKDFLAKAAEEEGAVKTNSGLIYRSLQEGGGATPAAEDKVKVHYQSSLIDGKEIESTYKNGQPDESIVKEFVKCLAEGVQLMKQGGKARLVCPPELALGKEGYGVIPPNATLVFDVELLEVTKQSPATSGNQGQPSPSPH
jgi:FKBP-type peptidyl-prolyl cis-trans isomerase FkpA